MMRKSNRKSRAIHTLLAAMANPKAIKIEPKYKGLRV
jgi:hypothetical protein